MKNNKYLYRTLLDHVVFNACDMTSYGLLDGMTGVCLVLYTLSRREKLHSIELYADYLLMKILKNLSLENTASFFNGFCGIAWGIDYLLKNGFVKGESNEICESIDAEIVKLAPSRLDDSLRKGFKGLLHYILAHSIQDGYSKEFFNQDFLNEVHCVANKHIAVGNDYEMVKLCLQFEQWYNGRPSIYVMSINDFVTIKPGTITCDNFASYPISLSNGLCGFLLNS